MCIRDSLNFINFSCPVGENFVEIFRYCLRGGIKTPKQHKTQDNKSFIFAHLYIEYLVGLVYYYVTASVESLIFYFTETPNYEILSGSFRTNFQQNLMKFHTAVVQYRGIDPCGTRGTCPPIFRSDVV